MYTVEPWQVDTVKLAFSILLGGVVGAERELRAKPAGFRTMILISLGATLFTIFSLRFGAAAHADPGRVAAQIVTGVGFLGAGAILHGRHHVTGLTTAASIWLVASLGIGAGVGAFGTTTAALVLVFCVLVFFTKAEALFDRVRHDETYRISMLGAPDGIEEIVDLARSNGLRVTDVQTGKSDDRLRLLMRAIGPVPQHTRFTAILLAEKRIVEFIRTSNNRAGLS